MKPTAKKLTSVHHSRLANVAAGCVIVGGTLLAWGSQYYVDYEVSLLPWLIEKGWVLYRDIADQHTPLFTALLVPFGAGDTSIPLQMVVVGLHFLTLLLVYLVTIRMAGAVAGLGAVILAELWTVAMEGTHLWYDGVLGLVYMAMLLLLVNKRSPLANKAPRLGTAIIAGLLLGIGILIKQHATAALPFIALLWWAGGYAGWRSHLGLFAAGLSAPLAIFSLVFAAQGALGEAWYWTVVYNITGNYMQAAAMLPAYSEWPVLVALFIPLALWALTWRIHKARDNWLAMALFGLVLAASLPAVPRYARFHFQALVPLAAVLGAVAAACLYESAKSFMPWRKVASQLGLGLFGLYMLVGLAQWIEGLSFNFRPGAVVAPYATSIEPLRAWVDANTPPRSPVFIYGLDSMLYRVLEREPTRPFSPQLPWVLDADNTEERWWFGFMQAHPAVVLVPAQAWDANSTGSREMQLRGQYREGMRFNILNYPGARPIEVVGLLQSNDPQR